MIDISFAEKLNDSPWKGSICEVGMGVPFQYEYLNIPGASKTILFTRSPYNQQFQSISKGIRSVSEGAVIELMHQDMDVINNHDIHENIFSLAISAVHSPKGQIGETHGWMALGYIKGGFQKTTLHFTVNKSSSLNSSRKGAGSQYNTVAQYLIEHLLLSNNLDNLSDVNKFDQFKVDVINNDTITIQQHLKLLTNTNPLIYHRGRFQRVVDYIRKYNRIYRGSFNPPTKAHEQIGKDCLFEICIDNTRKDSLSTDDISNRIKMLDSLDIPVMITKGVPYFSNLQDMIVSEFGRSKNTYVVGLDTFNAIIGYKYYDEKRDSVLISDVNFEVHKRKDEDIIENEYSKKLNFSLIEADMKISLISSSEIRNSGNYTEVSEPVKTYIEKNKLYK